MTEELNFLPSLTGSFAKPAAENPTVEMVEAAYRHHGLHWRYINTEVGPENLGAAVAGARAMNWAGFNCSLPNKVEVIQYIDGLGESAEVIGAVNCVVRRGDKLIGEKHGRQRFLEIAGKKSSIQQVNASSCLVPAERLERLVSKWRWLVRLILRS